MDNHENQCATMCNTKKITKAIFTNQSPDYATYVSIPYTYVLSYTIRGNRTLSARDGMCRHDLLCTKIVWGCHWGYSTHGHIPFVVALRPLF